MPVALLTVGWKFERERAKREAREKQEKVRPGANAPVKLLLFYLQELAVYNYLLFMGSKRIQ
jgi:hypothetical protein